MKRLFIVDYRENGISKYKCIETVGVATDAQMVTACHAYVGMHNDLDGVAEIFADMSTEELNKIAQTSKLLFFPFRYLFIDAKEVNRCANILKERRNHDNNYN